MQALYGLSGRQELLGLAQGCLCLELIQGLAQLLHLAGLLLHPLQQSGGRRFEELRSSDQYAAGLFHTFQAHTAAGSLYTAHTGSNAALGLDAEGPGLSGIIQVGTAAELHGEVAHLHHADGLAVLLTEHSHCALFLSLLNGQHLRYHGTALQNGIIDHPLHLAQLLGSYGLEMSEVEAQAIRLYQGASLMHMVAQDLLQSRIQQMCGGMGAADGLAPLGVDGRAHGIPYRNAAPGHMAVMHELAALVLLHVRHREGKALPGYYAVVCHLAAHFRIEGSLVQHHNAVTAFL